MTVLAAILQWCVKNPVATIAIGVAVAAGIYCGILKFENIGLNLDLAKCQGQLKDCNAAHKVRNEAIRRMGEERTRLNAELARRDAENAQKFKAAEVQIAALKKFAKANDCTGNLKRFSNQLEGVLW